MILWRFNPLKKSYFCEMNSNRWQDPASMIWLHWKLLPLCSHHLLHTLFKASLWYQREVLMKPKLEWIRQTFNDVQRRFALTENSRQQSSIFCQKIFKDLIIIKLPFLWYHNRYKRMNTWEQQSFVVVAKKTRPVTNGFKTIKKIYFQVNKR